MKRGIVLDYETADRICLGVLRDQLSYLKKELTDHIENGKWMHPEDKLNSETKYIPALKVIIDYFGGGDNVL